MAKPLFTGIDAAVAKMKKDGLRIKESVTEIKQKLVYEVYSDLVNLSPQWSGNLAKQWYIEVSGRKGSYRRISTYVSPKNSKGPSSVHYQRGDDPAVSEAIIRELSKISDIKWNSKVSIINHAPYAADVEAGIGPTTAKGTLAIRPENLYYGRVAMSEFVARKYNKLSTLRKI